MADDPLKAALLERAKRELAARQARQQDVVPEPPAQADAGAPYGSLSLDALQGQINDQEKLGADMATWLNRAGESLAGGLVGDEAAAWADSKLGRGSYDDRLQHYRDQEEGMSTGAQVSADIAGLLVPGAGVAGLAAKAPLGLVGRMGAAGLTGAGLGGVYGFMEGEGSAEDRMADAKQAATVSGLISAAVPVLGKAVEGVWKRGAASKANRAVTEATESTDGLLARAGGLYDDARRFGTVADGGITTQIADDANRTLSREGMITPKGAVAEAPKVRHAYQMLQDFAGEQMNPEQMQTVRKSLQSAARSADASEARVGTILIKQFDDAIEPLAPQFKEANALYRRAMKSEKIQEVIDLAGNKAGQYTGSGFENALRSEFRALNKRIIKGTEKGWTADEKAMISRIANGGTVENIARDLGKAAPRGVVSTGLAGGVPFMIGNAIGGPALGGALAAGSVAAGEIGRRTATRMQTKNAGLLEALARTETGMLPQISDQTGKLARKLIEGGLIGTALTQQR